MAKNEDEKIPADDMVIEQVKLKETGHNHKKKEISYQPQSHLSYEEIHELDQKYILPTYARMPVAFAYGSGEFLYDTEGKEYIDFLSGIAVTSVGHAHADLVEALNHQADLLWHTSNIFHNQQQAQLARAVVEINFPGKVFFCSTGTEANEAAIKIMKAHGQNQSPKKIKIVALKQGFHGRTLGSVSITGQEKVQGGFGDLLPNIEFVEANDTASLARAIDESTCGVILEPIQGEGGVLPLSPDFIQTARNLCDEMNALLTFDEIQTGVGRTGKYFAYQHYNVQPDLLTMAKGLGGGFPVGAVLVADQHTGILAPGMHGTTFGGNHLATAVAYEVLRIIESNKLLDNVNAMSDYLVEQLEQLKAAHPNIIKEIRGLGLLIGIVLRDDIEARPLVKQALDHQLVIGRAGENVLRLAPPLVLRQTTIDRAIERLEMVIKTIS